MEVELLEGRLARGVLVEEGDSGADDVCQTARDYRDSKGEVHIWEFAPKKYL